MKKPRTQREIEALAKKNWDADRAKMRIQQPEWPMPSWSKAEAWRKRPYLLEAKEGRRR